MVDRYVGVLGATSMVGKCFLPLLVQGNWQVTAYSRRSAGQGGNGVMWQRLPPSDLSSTMLFLPRGERSIPFWISAAPIWVLPAYFPLLEAHGVKRVVVLSSTSRFTKNNSSDMEEQAMAHRFADTEACVQAWAENHGVEWVILRPTLIYGLGWDKNITEIVRFIRRFGFFPLFGQAKGMRQPVHAQDVASACVTALEALDATNRAYNLSGGEIISYRDMVARVFVALGRPLRLLRVPLWVFRGGIALLRILPRYRHWSAAMAERMNQDLVFDHSEAVRDLSFEPRKFELSAVDLAT